MYCPLHYFAKRNDCTKCEKECMDFNLTIACEHPDNAGSLVTKLNRLLSRQKKVNILINGILEDGLLPNIPQSLINYFDSKGYNVVVINSFKNNQYDTLLRECMKTTGGGLLIYGSEAFSNYIQYRFQVLAKEYKGSDYENIFNKIKIKYTKEKYDLNPSIKLLEY